MDEKHITPSGSEAPAYADDHLSSRERDTVGELRRLDPHLAGLYERGLSLVREIDQPGNAYLVAHAGRELSRGVVRLLLSDEGLEVTSRDVESESSDEHDRPRIANALGLEPDDPQVDAWLCLIRQFSRNLKRRVAGPPSVGVRQAFERFVGLLYGRSDERNRPRIAKALSLEPDDASVDEWFYVAREFSRACHWRDGGPDPTAVREAFERFAGLLYGRLAPYYATETDLDLLLAIETPTREHAKQLRNLQLRPGQRNYFFRQLRNPTWVEHLAAERFFRSPPGRQTNDDGSWSVNPWPEGDYLVVAAPDEPEAVLEVLRSIPPTNDNPVVWDLAAKAARQLPAGRAARVVPRLNDALRTLPTWIHAESVAELVVFLAESGQKEAFDLASFFLRVVDPDEVRGVEGLGARQRTEWVFPCLVWYDDGERLERVVGALEAFDAKRTLRLLLSKVQRLGKLSDDLELGLDRRLADLHAESNPGRGNVVAMVISKTVAVAQRLAVRGETEASWVMKRIDSHDADVMTRIGYLVLAEAGPNLLERVDRVLNSSEMREPGSPATEIAMLLRSQFRNASPEGRRDYAAAVEAGPRRRRLRNRLRSLFRRKPTKEELDRIRRYQRRILTFFRGDIPEELRGLAERLDVLEVTPSLREQKLAEVGWYMGPTSWGEGPGDESPISAEELAQSSVGEIVALLVERTPGERIGSSPGFRRTLTEYGKKNAGTALEVLGGALREGADPSTLRAVLHGVHDAADAGSKLDWATALATMRRIVSHVRSVDPNANADVGQWRRTARVAIRLLEIGCRTDSVSSEHAGEVWQIISEVMATPVIWNVAHSDEPSLESVLIAELNDATGDAANAAISAALWDYRSRVGDEGEALTGAKAAARAAVQEKFVPVLDRWLRDQGPNAAVPRAVMGKYLPQVYLLAREWLEAHDDDLFNRGLEDPGSRPTWTTYVAHAYLYDDVFHVTRSWYLSAAKKPVEWREAVGDSFDIGEITQRYGAHLITAVLRGLVAVGGKDRLLETAYEHMLPSDWHRAYWLIFRTWSDRDEPPPVGFVQRLLGLWEWRISQLETEPDAATTVEEAKELGWLFHTPHLPDADRIRLGLKTARLAHGQLQMYSRWDEMLLLAQGHPDGTFSIAEEVLLAELRADYGHVPVEDVRPFLAHILSAGSADTQLRARRMVNQLGERGYRQLKDLLDEDGETADG